MTGNQYLQVTEAFTVLVKVGTTDSNTYIGVAQVCGDVWAPRTLQPGDQLHLLVGGEFAAVDGVRWPAALRVSQAHPFERNAGHPKQNWPTDKLRPVTAPAPGAYTVAPLRDFDLGWVRAHGQPNGHSIDWTLAELP